MRHFRQSTQHQWTAYTSMNCPYKKYAADKGLYDRPPGPAGEMGQQGPEGGQATGPGGRDGATRPAILGRGSRARRASRQQGPVGRGNRARRARWGCKACDSGPAGRQQGPVGEMAERRPGCLRQSGLWVTVLGFISGSRILRPASAERRGRLCGGFPCFPDL